MNTKENNKLLAEFLGVKPHGDWFDGHELQNIGLPFNYGAMGNGTSTLRFSTSWDWLMVVVDKIEDLGYTVETKINWCRIKDNGETISLRWETDATKIESVYNACIEFVQWHKEQNNKQGNG